MKKQDLATIFLSCYSESYPFFAPLTCHFTLPFTESIILIHILLSVSPPDLLFYPSTISRPCPGWLFCALFCFLFLNFTKGDFLLICSVQDLKRRANQDSASVLCKKFVRVQRGMTQWDLFVYPHSVEGISCITFF